MHVHDRAGPGDRRRDPDLPGTAAISTREPGRPADSASDGPFVEGPQARRPRTHRHDVAVEGPGVRKAAAVSGARQVHERRPAAERPHREAAADDLAHDDEVRVEA